MFDSVRNSKLLVKGILLLLILPFALWGVDSYVRGVGPGAEVAKVGSSKITPGEFQQALREQQDRLRSALGPEFKPALLDAPEAREAVLDALINQRLLALHAIDEKLTVGDDQLRDYIFNVPAFQVDGKFSVERYDQFLRAQGLSREGLDSRLRQQLSWQQIGAGVSATAIVSNTEVQRWLALQQEERTISAAVIRPEAYMSESKPAAEAVKAYYDANSAAFETPERVKAEYLVFDQTSLMGKVKVSADDIRGHFENNRGRYQQPEERRASHILVLADRDAAPEKVAAAKAKIDDIASQLRRNPGDFARLAKQSSEDPGSAANGGDLGFFPRGAMLKEFEDAAFALKENQLSDVVRSDFGFHLIKVTGIKPAQGKQFEDVREEIEADLRRQAAGREFAKMAESFSNTVYEQADSLKPAAESFGLTIRSSDWLLKGVPGAAEFANERLMKLLFSDDAIKNHRNTEAIEVAPGRLVSARVVEHKPAGKKAFDAVKVDIEALMTRQEAVKRAVAAGTAALAKLSKGEAQDLVFAAPKVLRRSGDDGLATGVLRDAFKLDAKALPGYVGGELKGGGYTIYKVIESKQAAAPADKASIAALRGQFAQAIGERDLGAYLTALRDRYAVVVNRSALEIKER